VTPTPPRTATVLIGLRGSGKTTLGRLLAARRAVLFVDLDDRTLACGGHDSVSAMFRDMGEAAFREAERTALEAALEIDVPAGSVIALGGGTPTAPGARALLEAARDAGRIRIILLEAPPAVLGARLAAAPGDRPLLVGADFAEEAEILAARRMPGYRTLAQATVITAGPMEASLAELERVA
jgi:shikimate kinase